MKIISYFLFVLSISSYGGDIKFTEKDIILGAWSTDTGRSESSTGAILLPKNQLTDEQGDLFGTITKSKNDLLKNLVRNASGLLTPMGRLFVKDCDDFANPTPRAALYTYRAQNSNGKLVTFLQIRKHLEDNDGPEICADKNINELDRDDLMRILDGWSITAGLIWRP